MSMDKIEELLTRGVEKIYPSKEALEKILRSGKKLRLYNGIDPTGTRLHLGHTIPLKKLQQFADLGHEAILVIGTGTVLAGDPSQRDTSRPHLTQEEIEENIKTWKSQAEKILDFSKVKVKYNGEWLLKLNLAKLLEIASNISAVQLIKREMFQKRIEHGDTVWTHEILYPLLQGYDSVAMDVDLEIGGTDQTFNMLIGRELQKKMNNREKYVLTVPMIFGTDGKPMSKTSDNCIWLVDSPNDMFVKVMSIRDSQIKSYLTLLTDVELTGIDFNKSLTVKKRLAFEIVKNLHGEKKAREAGKYFEKTVQKQELPQDIPIYQYIGSARENILDLLVQTKLVSSRSEAKRLVEQGGVEIDQSTITNQQSPINIKEGMIIRVGKRKFLKLVVSSYGSF